MLPISQKGKSRLEEVKHLLKATFKDRGRAGVAMQVPSPHPRLFPTVLRSVQKGTVTQRCMWCLGGGGSSPSL